MTSSTHDALAREWTRAAYRARARYVRRLMVMSGLVLLMLLGLLQLGAILLWTARTTTWWALVPVALHALGIVLAIGWPAHSGSSLLGPVRGFKEDVARRFGDRAERLRALRSVVVLESAILFAGPLAQSLVTGDTPRWGVAFTTAICSLLILWPLQRIADAQGAESRWLLGVDDRDAR